MTSKGTDTRTSARSLRLTIVPTTLKVANAYIAQYHRHNRPVPGCISVVGVSDGERLRGVAVVGRPIARALDDGFTAEVRRCCTDGAPNACSMLYRAAWRAVKALGYRKVITYTLPEEGGASLKASGFTLAGAGRRRTLEPPRPPRRRHAPDRQEAALGAAHMSGSQRPNHDAGRDAQGRSSATQGTRKRRRRPRRDTGADAPLRLLPGRTRPMRREQERQLVRRWPSF